MVTGSKRSENDLYKSSIKNVKMGYIAINCNCVVIMGFGLISRSMLWWGFFFLNMSVNFLIYTQRVTFNLYLNS